jgi:hypothetical protein
VLLDIKGKDGTAAFQEVHGSMSESGTPQKKLARFEVKVSPEILARHFAAKQVSSRGSIHINALSLFSQTDRAGLDLDHHRLGCACAACPVRQRFQVTLPPFSPHTTNKQTNKQTNNTVSRALKRRIVCRYQRQTKAENRPVGLGLLCWPVRFQVYAPVCVCV